MRGSTGMSGAIEVGIIMGSRSDWDTMRHAAETLDALGVPHECKVVSAHRTPQRLYDYATSAVSRGLKVIIAGAGGASLCRSRRCTHYSQGPRSEPTIVVFRRDWPRRKWTLPLQMPRPILTASAATSSSCDDRRISCLEDSLQ